MFGLCVVFKRDSSAAYSVLTIVNMRKVSLICLLVYKLLSDAEFIIKYHIIVVGELSSSNAGKNSQK